MHTGFVVMVFFTKHFYTFVKTFVTGQESIGDILSEGIQRFMSHCYDIFYLTFVVVRFWLLLLTTHILIFSSLI